MQVHPEKINTVSSGGFETATMGFDASKLDQVAHLFRDQIYTNVKLAVVREYFCNAIDEHNSHNIERPIEVELKNGELSFRDFAKGLSKKDIFSIFFQYLASTKTGGEHGGFGIGAKAALAYSDVFFVDSFFEGVQTSYSGLLEDTGGFYPEGKVLVLSEQPTNETGIKVTIPILEKDVNEFNEVILNIAKFSKSKFLFNQKLIGGEVPEGWESIPGFLFERGCGEVKVRLGDVVYPCSPKTLPPLARKFNVIILAENVNNCSVPPSREAIKMDKRSENFVEQRLKHFLDSVMRQLSDGLVSKSWRDRFLTCEEYNLPEKETVKDYIYDIYLNFKYPSITYRNSSYNKRFSTGGFSQFLDLAFRRRVVLGTPMSNIKRNQTIGNYGNVVFLEIEENQGVKLLECLGVKNYILKSEIQFPKYVRTTKTAQLKIVKKTDFKGHSREYYSSYTGPIEVYAFSRGGGKPILKFDTSLYNFDFVLVPLSRKGEVKNARHADDVVSEKLKKAENFAKKYQGKILNNLLIKSDQYIDYIKFLKETGKTIKKQNFKIPIEVMFTNHFEKIKKLSELRLDKIRNKCDTFEFRVINALRSLPEHEYQLAKSKIL